MLKATVGGKGGDLAGILGDVTVEARSWIEEVLCVFINALHFPLKANRDTVGFHCLLLCESAIRAPIGPEERLVTSHILALAYNWIYLHHFEDDDLPSGSWCEGLHLEEVRVPGQTHSYRHTTTYAQTKVTDSTMRNNDFQMSGEGQAYLYWDVPAA